MLTTLTFADLSLTDFRYEALFLWGSHANLQGPAYPVAVEDPVAYSRCTLHWLIAHEVGDRGSVVSEVAGLSLRLCPMWNIRRI